MNKQNETLKKAMIAALGASLGIVSTACKVAGIERCTHYRWLKDDEQYKEQVESISEDAIDFVESKLYNQIDEGNVTAIIFYLKTKGKKRGYTESNDAGQGHKVIIEFEKDSEK